MIQHTQNWVDIDLVETEYATFQEQHLPILAYKASSQ